MIRMAALLIVLLATWLSLTPRPPRIEGLPADSDLVVHAIMHAGVAGALWMGWPQRGAWVAAMALILAVLLEAGQLWVPGRVFSFGDLRANLFGAAVGMLLAARVGLPLLARLRRLRAPASPAPRGTQPDRHCRRMPPR